MSSQTMQFGRLKMWLEFFKGRGNHAPQISSVGVKVRGRAGLARVFQTKLHPLKNIETELLFIWMH